MQNLCNTVRWLVSFIYIECHNFLPTSIILYTDFDICVENTFALLLTKVTKPNLVRTYHAALG